MFTHFYLSSLLARANKTKFAHCVIEKGERAERAEFAREPLSCKFCTEYTLFLNYIVEQKYTCAWFKCYTIYSLSHPQSISICLTSLYIRFLHSVPYNVHLNKNMDWVSSDTSTYIFAQQQEAWLAKIT